MISGGVSSDMASKNIFSRIADFSGIFGKGKRECQEQEESSDTETVYETESRPISFTVSRVQRSCHYLRPPQKLPTRRTEKLVY